MTSLAHVTPESVWNASMLGLQAIWPIAIFVWSWLVARRASMRVEKKLDASIVAIMGTVVSQMRKIADAADPASLHTLDMRFPDGTVLHVPLVIGRAIPVWIGLIVTGIRSNDQGTFYLVESTAGAELPEHSHEERETVTVIDGMMMDLKTGSIYRKGDSWVINGGESHHVYFEAGGLFSVVAEPPLKLAADRPVKMDGFEDVV